MEATAQAGQVSIRIKEFETRYRTDPKTGKEKAYDVVFYFPFNQNGNTLVCKEMHDIINILPLDDPHNIPLVTIHARKNAILPHYDAWKKGNELPLDGTPLSAWGDLNKNMLSILKHAGFSTVEQFANCLDSALGLVKLPNPRELRERARVWVNAKGEGVAVAQINDLKDQNAMLTEQLGEMTKAIKSLQSESLQKREAEASDKKQQNAREERRQNRQKAQAAATPSGGRKDHDDEPPSLEEIEKRQSLEEIEKRQEELEDA